MGALFGMGSKKPKPDEAMLASQRRQERTLQKQEHDAQTEMGARNRLLAARAKGRGPVTMFSETGGAGVTLGG